MPDSVLAPPAVLDFVLSPDLEAHEPPEARGLRRDEVRLLVTRGSAPSGAIHARFADLPRFLDAGDVLVVNDSGTLPAALTAHRLPDGGEVALHLSTRLPAPTGLPERQWVVEPRLTTVQAGQVYYLPADGTATLLAPYGGSRRLWVARLDLPLPDLAYLRRWGRPIAYPYVRGAWPIEMYQTVYAAEPGSAEMPSAGRAFTGAVLAALEQKGVLVRRLTLHTGVASLKDHEPPYAEPYRVPAATAEAVNRARVEGRHVVAVGTTVVRALETVADGRGRVHPGRGWTNVVITPQRGVRVVTTLLTGFHEPKASHLAMLEAIAGRAHLERAYHEALEHGYLWHEFGDLHLML